MSPRLPRLALVSDYSLATLGGAENAYHAQARALGAVTGVLAVSPSCARLADLGTHGVATLPVRAWTPDRRLGFPVVVNTARLRERLARAFTDHGVEVVHVHSEFGLAAAAVSAARRLGLPVVATVHTFFWQAGSFSQLPLLLLTRPLYRALTSGRLPRARLADRPGDSSLRAATLAMARAVDLVISPSAHQAERLREVGVDPVTVIPNTVAANPDAVPVARVDAPLRLLWVGRFAAEKRVLPFVRAARAAIDEVGPDRLRVDLLGDGPQHAAVRELAGGGIHLHGRRPADEVPQWLAGCHASVLTSVGWDNQPMTVAESIMAGRGVVYCDPRLTEGLDRAGIPAFGGDSVLRERLVDLAYDPAPVVAASRAALAVRGMFGTDAFVANAAEAYAGLPGRAARAQG